MNVHPGKAVLFLDDMAPLHPEGDSHRFTSFNYVISRIRMIAVCSREQPRDRLRERLKAGGEGGSNGISELFLV